MQMNKQIIDNTSPWRWKSRRRHCPQKITNLVPSKINVMNVRPISKRSINLASSAGSELIFPQLSETEWALLPAFQKNIMQWSAHLPFFYGNFNLLFFIWYIFLSSYHLSAVTQFNLVLVIRVWSISLRNVFRKNVLHLRNTAKKKNRSGFSYILRCVLELETEVLICFSAF